jgi:cytochrome P450
VFSPLLGNGIFTQEGIAWKHSRELLRKQFVRTQYQNLDHFREHVENLIARLPAEEGLIDLQPLFFSLTLDTTTALLLGQSVYSLKAQTADDVENRNFAENFTIAQEGLAKRFRIAPFHFLYSPPKFRRACKAVHQFVEGYIKEMNLQQQNDVKTEELYGFINQVAQESATTEDLRDQLLNVFARRAGHNCLLPFVDIVRIHQLLCNYHTNQISSITTVVFWSATLMSWIAYGAKSPLLWAMTYILAVNRSEKFHI